MAQPTAADSCPHTFHAKSLTKPVPTYCAECSDLIWIFQAKPMHCSICGIFIHEPCFDAFNQKRLPESHRKEKGGGVVVDPSLQRAEHTHEFSPHGYGRPHTCDACHKLLHGLGTEGYECTGCDTIMHRECAEKVPNAIVLRRGDDASAHEAELLTRNAAMGDIFSLLGRFSERNKRWQYTALNPFALMKLYTAHSDVFIAECDSLPDATISDVELDLLTKATRFATAAYGEAYLQGHFTSVTSNSMLRVTSTHLLHPKEENHVTAIAQILGCPKDRIVMAHISHSIYGATYYIAVEYAEDGKSIGEVILSFRGTLTDADWLTDSASGAVDFCGGRAHEGMARVVEQVFSEGACITTIQNILTLHPGAVLTVVGHSLGAAITELFVAKAKTEKTFGDSTKVRGFAIAPPPVATSPFAEQFDDCIVSLVAGKDMVPRLQLNSVDRLGRTLAKQKQKSDDGAAAKETNTTPATDDAVSPSSPSSAAPQIDDFQEEMHILGRIFLLTHPDNNAQKGRLVSVPRTSTNLHSIFLSRSMVLNHFMDHYQKGLQTVAVKKRRDVAAAAAAPKA